jgi:hypothetical protein
VIAIRNDRAAGSQPIAVAYGAIAMAYDARRCGDPQRRAVFSCLCCLVEARDRPS